MEKSKGDEKSNEIDRSRFFRRILLGSDRREIRRNQSGGKVAPKYAHTILFRGPVLDIYVLISFHFVYESPLRFTTDHRNLFSPRMKVKKDRTSGGAEKNKRIATVAKKKGPKRAEHCQTRFTADLL